MSNLDGELASVINKRCSSRAALLEDLVIRFKQSSVVHIRCFYSHLFFFCASLGISSETDLQRSNLTPSTGPDWRSCTYLLSWRNCFTRSDVFTEILSPSEWQDLLFILRFERGTKCYGHDVQQINVNWDKTFNCLLNRFDAKYK